MDERVFIVCVDRRLEEDLLFWQTFVREVSDSRGHPPMFIVLGSSERCARMVEAAGGPSTRIGGALRLESSSGWEAFERASRVDGRRIVQLLTDSGVSSVGFAGFDRGILIRDESGHLAASQVGSMTAWCRSGVIPVLMSSARNSEGEILDVHPVTACISIAEQMFSNNSNQLGDIVLLLNILSGDLAEKIDSCSELDPADLAETDAFLDPPYAGLQADFPFRVLVSHVSFLAEMKHIRLKTR